MAADLIIADDAGNENWIGDSYPRLAGDGFKSIPEAVKAGIGQLIDKAIQRDVDADIVNDLRDELKRLENGGEPMAFPKEVV